jgi:hypothetical protein
MDNIMTSSGNQFAVMLTSDVNVTLIGNRIQNAGTNYGLQVKDTDGSFFGMNTVTGGYGGIYIDHSAGTCDFNRFALNNVWVIASSAGSPTGNTYVDNYPDNTP